MTFTNDPAFVEPVKAMMLTSRQAAVDYMTPLGLAHLMARGHHYGPGPWVDDAGRADQNSTYFHRADAGGIGFDRTATGSNAVGQYAAPWRDMFGRIDRVPDDYLLWFHHVPWDHRMRSGRTLWDEMALDYQQGVNWIRAARKQWDSLKGTIDPERHKAVARKLWIQERDAVWWKDAGLTYFQTFSKRPLPRGVEKPKHDLETYKTKDLLDDAARGLGTFDEDH
jgi:alpha-glucuronidase